MSDGMLFTDTADLERRARSRDPETSWASAAIPREDSSELSAWILLVLAHGPLTDDELYAQYIDAGGKRTPQRLRTEREALVHPKRGEPLVRAAALRGRSRLGNPCSRWELVHTGQEASWRN